MKQSTLDRRSLSGRQRGRYVIAPSSQLSLTRDHDPLGSMDGSGAQPGVKLLCPTRRNQAEACPSESVNIPSYR